MPKNLSEAKGLHYPTKAAHDCETADTEKYFRRNGPLVARKPSVQSRHVLDADCDTKETATYRLKGAAPIPTQSATSSRVIDRRHTQPADS
jgi:hypothetical protein